MSENGVFDNTVETVASTEGPDGKAKITLEGILKEYDAKKAAAEKQQNDAEKSYESSAFMKEIEALDGGAEKTEEFESEEGKAILKDLGIEGNYEGIGHLVLGYAAGPEAEPAPRKENYVYRA
jgi:hypothetical protein